MEAFGEKVVSDLQKVFIPKMKKEVSKAHPLVEWSREFGSGILFVKSWEVVVEFWAREVSSLT